MPTKKQLQILREAEMEFPETRPDFEPISKELPVFTGEVIGVIKYDPKNKDLKIIVDEKHIQ